MAGVPVPDDMIVVIKEEYEVLKTGHEWAMDLMHLWGEVKWMAEQPDEVEMATAQQFARNLLDDMGK